MGAGTAGGMVSIPAVAATSQRKLVEPLLPATFRYWLVDPPSGLMACPLLEISVGAPAAGIIRKGYLDRKTQRRGEGAGIFSAGRK